MKRLALVVLVSWIFPASADRMPLPADTPPSYRAECASCHLAYPPALLGAGDWRRIMADLNEHFGSDAAVDRQKAQEIRAFLERHAGSTAKLGSAGDPPRISRTAAFIREHRKIPVHLWQDPRVKSPANCEACHAGAADGRYSEHDMLIPELKR
jgi:phage-related protein